MIDDELDNDLIEEIDEFDAATDSKNLVTGKAYSKLELEEMADAILREDSNQELCRQCKESNEKKKLPDPEFLPYGEATGHIEWQIQNDGDGVPQEDDEGNTLYVAFPELQCAQGHHWYKGEGTRRDIRGPNPILFESHLYYRRRREIQVEAGVPDPAYTMDRWGKRPTQGIYGRTHPSGRKVNSKESREKSGSSFYR